MPTRNLEKAFVVRVERKPRLLFTIKERENLDLLIVLKHSRYAAKFRTADGSLRRIKEEHVSIHNSPESPTKINMITYRVRLHGMKDWLPLDSHFTSALKQYSNYTPVFSHRCANLGDDYYTLKSPGADVITLDEYDPKHFQLCLMVLVSTPETESFGEERRTNVRHINFTNFKVSVVWSFLSLASDSTAMTVRIPTIRPEELDGLADESFRSLAKLLPKGFSPTTCVIQFAAFRTELKSQFIESSIENMHDLPEEVIARHRRLQNLVGEFFTRGSVSDLKYRQHGRRCERVLRGDPLFLRDATFRSAFDIPDPPSDVDPSKFK